MGKKTPDEPKRVPFGMKIFFGALSGCMSTTIVQPADLVKTRMQLRGPECAGMSTFAISKKIIKGTGFKGLYRGFSAALARQVLFSGARLGGYNELIDIHKEKNSGYLPNLGTMILYGMVAGAVGAVLSMPSEVALIRMTADGRAPSHKRRNYKNVFDAMIRMAREEGLGTLKKGFWPTMTRSMLINAAQMATYTEAREALVKSLGPGKKNHFVSSMISGLITTIVSQPVDTIKTKIQHAKKPMTQFSVLKRVVQTNGFLGLWAGFLPNYLKIGPHTVLTLMFLEQMNYLYLKYT